MRKAVRITRHCLSFLRHLGRVRANEIKMYDDNDQLIYTSPPSQYKQGKWAPDWFTRLADPKIGEFRLNLPNGAVVITSDASRSILDAWDDLKSFFWLVLGFFVLVNVLVFWLLGRSLRPIGKILGGLSEMEKGRFDTRLPRFELPEFDAISHTFNRMAENLEESLAENRRLALVAKQSSDAIIIHDLEGAHFLLEPGGGAACSAIATDEIVGRSATLLDPAGTAGRNPGQPRCGQAASTCRNGGDPAPDQGRAGGGCCAIRGAAGGPGERRSDR